MCAFTSVQVHMGVHVLVVHVEGSEVIPQAPSSLFGETGSVAGLELNKWLSWLAIKPRGVYLSQPPQDWGTYLSLPRTGVAHTNHYIQLFYMDYRNQTQVLMPGKGHSESEAGDAHRSSHGP